MPNNIGTFLKSIGAAALPILLVFILLQAAQVRSAAAGDLDSFLGSQTNRRFVDQDGKVIAADRMEDRVVAVAFFSTDCSILCVDRLMKIAAVVKGLPVLERSRIRVVALTVDPAHDTPDALKSFSDALKLDTTAVTLASGEPGGVAAMLASTGWRPGGGEADRMPSTIFVFDRHGTFAMRYGANPLDRHRLAQDLTALAGLDSGVGQHVRRVSTLD